MGIDLDNPRFSWMCQSGQRGQKQTAYHILVASTREKLDENIGDLWDSGKVKSGQSLNLVFGGEALVSRRQYFWKVRVWGKDGRPANWSETGSFMMGILNPDEWSGQWIRSDLELFDFQKELKLLPKFVMIDFEGKRKRHSFIMESTHAAREAPAVWLRKEFPAKKELRRATAFVSGLGFYELYLNGEKLDGNYFNTAIADYSKSVPYLAHDVTDKVVEGINTIGTILGNGHFNPVVPFLHREYASDFIETPRLRCELVLEYEDGSSEVIGSDGSWRFTTDGPIRFNSLRSGETYDARQELGNWSASGYDDKGWKQAIFTSGPAGRPRIQSIPPVRVIKEIPAVTVVPVDGGWRFDIGVQNAGWARLTFRGRPGQRITIKYPGESNHTMGPYQTCTYICKGGGEETFEPRFSYNGYQYVEVYGLETEPNLQDCVGLRVASDLVERGHFSCSDERLNKLQDVHLRTIRNYYVQMPSDPVREKAVWTQDVQTHLESVGYNYDLQGLFGKWQQDYLDHVLPNGYVPAIVPSCFAGHWINGPWWGGMIIYNPWQLYRFYGDKEVLAKSYPAMKHYYTYLDSISEDHIISWGLGDWQDALAQLEGYGKPMLTSVPYTSTCAYFHYADILRQTALLVGRADEAAYYKDKMETIRKAIHARFFDSATGIYDTGSQTALILALRLGIGPEEERGRVIELLRNQIVEDDYHLSSGFVGLPFLLPELTETGLGDLAWRIATRETYPGWFDMVFSRENSAFMEAWDGGHVQMPSLAAPIGAWFYRSLGGIRPETPGFKTFIIEPYTKTLDWVKCVYKSPYGSIVSNWSKKDGVLTMNVTVPVNTTATVYVDGEQVTESGKPAKQAEGVTFLRMEKNRAAFELGSGKYEFKSLVK
ncbi:MAG: family 78 glycoside hydrolase catalytic domain [Bacteroidetes bacterium]|nr:family 78 glycoside hydrolase catalytic domain [Bacteroidota bacterium]